MPTELVSFLKDIHLMDIILFLIIIGFAFLGFTKGMVKLFIVLVAIYIGFLLGAIYYLPLADLIHNLFHLGLSKVAEVAAFLLINVVVSALLGLLLYQFFGHLALAGRAGACIDRPIGMLLGFATGILFCTILVVLVEVPYDTYKELSFAGGQAPLFGMFHEWYISSVLAPTLRGGLPVLLGSVSPILGGHVPLLLTQAPGS